MKRHKKQKCHNCSIVKQGIFFAHCFLGWFWKLPVLETEIYYPKNDSSYIVVSHF